MSKNISNGLMTYLNLVSDNLFTSLDMSEWRTGAFYIEVEIDWSKVSDAEDMDFTIMKKNMNRWDYITFLEKYLANTYQDSVLAYLKLLGKTYKPYHSFEVEFDIINAHIKLSRMEITPKIEQGLLTYLNLVSGNLFESLSMTKNKGSVLYHINQSRYEIEVRINWKNADKDILEGMYDRNPKYITKQILRNKYYKSVIDYFKYINYDFMSSPITNITFDILNIKEFKSNGDNN